MRAVWITKAGGPEVLEVRETPDLVPKPGEVRIRTGACGMNFAEMMARQGLYPDAPKIPCIVGYEAAGIIDSVGDGVDRGLIGKRVVVLARFGTHADQVCVPHQNAFPIPDEMSFEEAAAVPVNYLTAYQMLFRVAAIQPGASRCSFIWRQAESASRCCNYAEPSKESSLSGPRPRRSTKSFAPTDAPIQSTITAPTTSPRSCA